MKLKLPIDCEIFKLEDNYTFLHNRRDKVLLMNHIDDKTHKLEWK